MSKFEEFKDIFTCKYCKDKLKDPIILPCGESICRFHEAELTSRSCPLCDATHVEPPNGFLTNRALKKMIELGANNVDVNLRVLNDCKKSIDQLNITATFVNSIRKDPSAFIYNHFGDFKREVDLRYEQLKLELDKCYKNLIFQIEVTEKKSHNQFEQNHFGKFTDNIEEHNAHLKNLEEKLNSFEINERVYEKIIQGSKILKTIYDRRLSYYAGLLLNNEKYKFEFENIQLEKYMGAFQVIKPIINPIVTEKTQVKAKKAPNFENPFPSGILNNDQTAFDLMNLCQFSETQKWQLIYKASQDGFEAKNFHQQCNEASKTLTLIKTKDGYVFGGYTSQKWGKNEGYIEDSECFIFGLINAFGIPFKIECPDKRYAIFNSPSKGPIFGKLSNPNIFIMSSSNKSWRNRFYLNGFDTQFLAGVDFYIKEIEVYSKI